MDASGRTMTRDVTKTTLFLVLLVISISLDNAKAADSDETKDVQSQRHHQKLEPEPKTQQQEDQRRLQDQSERSHHRYEKHAHNHDRARDYPKERPTPTVEGVESTSVESKIHKQSGFFVADDGKSIKLPKSDVIYNPETGEILVRNRHFEKKIEERESPNKESVKTTMSRQNYYNIKPDDEGFKNLQGFVIADGDKEYAKQYLYPASSDSQEISETKAEVSSENSKRKQYSIRSGRESDQNVSEEDMTEDNATDYYPDHTVRSHSKTNSDSSTDSQRIGKQALNTEDDKSKKSERSKHHESHRQIDNRNDSFEHDQRILNKKDDERFAKYVDESYDNYKRDKEIIATLEEVPTIKYAEEDTTIIPKSYTKEDLTNESLESLNENLEVEINNISNSVISEKMIEVDNNSDAQSLEEVEELFRTTTTTQPADPLMVLRNYMEDTYLRGPIAVVVDTEANSLAMAKEALNAMEQAGGVLNIPDIVLIAYNVNGITWMSHHKATKPQQLEFEVKAFKKALNGLKPSQENGNPLNALMRASRLLPYDSAIFLFNNGQNDPEMTREEDGVFIGQLLSKRIKLYVICGGTGGTCIGGAAGASGGGQVKLRERRYELESEPVQYLRGERALDVYYDESEETADSETIFDQQDTIALRKSLNGSQLVDMPIDSTVKTITVSITGSPEKASLYSPSGNKINLLEESSVEKFSEGSEILSLSPTAAVRLVMMLDKIYTDLPDLEDWNVTMNESSSEESHTIEAVSSGVWRLAVKGNSTTYNVQVDAESAIHVFAKVTTQYTGIQTTKKNIKISVGGPLKSVKEALIIDKNGQLITSLSTYTYQRPMMYTNDATEIETLRVQESGVSSKVIPLPADITKDQTFYVQINGINDKDEAVTRISQELQIPLDELSNIEEKLSNVIEREDNDEGIGRGVDDIEAERISNSNNNATRQSQITTIDGVPMTVIQIGGATRLHGAPGVQMQIHFEVTNNRDNAVFFRFHAKDEQYYLRSMIPQTQWVNGGQTVNVVLTVGITSNAENGLRDTVIFTASGIDQTSINAYVYVVSDARIENDGTRPYLTYSYRGDCMGYLNNGCETRTWGLDITARDSESGILRIATTPGGVIYGANFHAGSREEVYARYTASCCTPRVHISAIDLNGNSKSYDINVSEYLTPATIAAIVLGVLLLIALIIVAVLVIRWILRKKRDSRELPSYQTQRVT